MTTEHTPEQRKAIARMFRPQLEGAFLDAVAALEELLAASMALHARDQGTLAGKLAAADRFMDAQDAARAALVKVGR